MLDRHSAEAITHKALGMTDADDATVVVDGKRREHLRFANNQVTTSGIDYDQEITVTVSYGTRSGTASSNRLDKEGLQAVVKAAEELARVAPEDPEHMPSVGGQTYLAPNAWREAEQPDSTVLGAAKITGMAANKGLVASGFVNNGRNVRAVATKNDLFGFDVWTTSVASTTVRTPDGDGSGWAADAARTEEEIDWDGLAERASTKAERSVGAKPLEPGKYVTIFEPSATAELANLLRWSLDRRRMDEGRSWLSRPGGKNALNEPLFPEWLTVISHPTDNRAPGRVFTRTGMSNMPTFWIQKGKLSRVPCSRYWAQKNKLGHQMPPPNWLWNTGQKESLEDLIKRTERGVLVTSLWYIRSVDPRQLLYTGLTRDGTFWIEDGEIRHPLKNMRWNDSPLTVFGQAIDAGESVRAVARSGSGDTVVPPLRTKAFHFTSVSEAV